MKQITKDWLETASLDLESIPLIIQNDRLTGHVAFHSQQAVEKSLKALIEEKRRKSSQNSLSKLFELCAIIIKLPIDENIIISLDSLYIESRYPGEFGLLPDGKPNQKQAQKFYEFAIEVNQTIKNYLENV